MTDWRAEAEKLLGPMDTDGLRWELDINAILAFAERYAAEQVREEREACAHKADGWANSQSCGHHDDNPCCHIRTGVGIAAAIRARGEGA